MKFAGSAFFFIGFLVILHPMVTEIASEIIYGGALLFGGFAYFLLTFANLSPLNFWHFLLSLLFMGVGMFLTFFPEESVLTIASALAIGFAAQSVVQFVIAFSGSAGASRLWMLISGLFALLASGAMMYGLPLDATWVIGAVTGTNLVLLGLSLIAIPRTTVDAAFASLD